jgi:serine/threonine protein kinase
MAPEQMVRGITNKTTDIYSFGMTIYEIFTGAAPFANTIDSYLFVAVVDRAIRPLRPTESAIVQYGLDDTLWALIEECWSQEPKDRPIAATVASRLALLSPTGMLLVCMTSPSDGSRGV